MGFSTNIKLLRDRFSLHQEDIAKIAGVTNKAVSTWESGKRQPKMGIVQLLANHFNLSVSNLIEDDGMSADKIAEARIGDDGINLVEIIVKNDKISINGKLLPPEQKQMLLDFLQILIR